MCLVNRSHERTTANIAQHSVPKLTAEKIPLWLKKERIQVLLSRARQTRASGTLFLTGNARVLQAVFDNASHDVVYVQRLQAAAGARLCLLDVLLAFAHATLRGKVSR